MTYNYPYFSFPHFRRYTNYYPVNYSYARQSSNANSQFKVPVNNQFNSQTNNSPNLKNEKSKYYKLNCSDKKETTNTKKAPSGFSFLNNIFHQEDRNEDEEYFELLGLKLYQDDLLLIGLIFFLYKEDVKDQYLFFALILLLLS